MTSPQSETADSTASPVKMPPVSSISVSGHNSLICQSQQMAASTVDEASFQSYQQPQMNDGTVFLADQQVLLSEPASTVDQSLQQIRAGAVSMYSPELANGKHYQLSVENTTDGSALFRTSLDPDCSTPRSCANNGYSAGWQEERAYPPSVYQINVRPQHLPLSDCTYQPYLPSDYLQNHNLLATPGNVQDSFSGHEQGAIDPVDACDGSPLSFTQLPLPSDSLSPAAMEADPKSPSMESAREKDLPYAKLIFKCLLEAPGHTMVLKDIYLWFVANTDKGQDPTDKGWQNSIRHNLSMNKAFQKIDQGPGEEPRRGYVWRLSEEALRAGCVQSTTRYRNKQPNKRGSKSRQPAPFRQASGSKGGAMSRKTSALRRSERLRVVTDTVRRNKDRLRKLEVIRRGGTPTRYPFSGSPPRSTFRNTVSTGSTPSPAYDLDVEMPENQLPFNFNMLYVPRADAIVHPVQEPFPHYSSGSTAGLHELYPSSPSEYGPIPEPLFYDSPDSRSQSQTPSAFGHTPIDPSSTFYNSQVDELNSHFEFSSGA